MKEPVDPALRPRFAADERALGWGLALALHLVPFAILTKRAVYTESASVDAPPPPPAVIAASLLKLGQARDPKQLPDRVVAQARTAKHQETIASQTESPRALREAGAPPPPDTQDSDLANLVARSDPFAEPAKPRPEFGDPNGHDAGRETDPAQVRAGDAYALTLAEFFRARWDIPSVISPGAARKLCAVFQVRIDGRMLVWNVTREAVRSSNSELFDDSIRSMLMKLMESQTPLPAPPAGLESAYRGATVELALSGDPQGDAARCKR